MVVKICNYHIIFVDCKCDKNGSKSNICNRLNGECDCKTGYSVFSNCEACDYNYVKDTPNGVCVCRKGYVGNNCQSCGIGYYITINLNDNSAHCVNSEMETGLVPIRKCCKENEVSISVLL